MIPISIPLSIYVVAWLCAIIFFIKKNKAIGIGGILLFTYFVSSLGSIVYFWGIGGFLLTGQDISWEPLVFLFISLNICMLPIYRHSNELSQLQYTANSNGNIFLEKLILFLSPFIIWATFELFFIAITTNTSGLGELYEDDSFALSTLMSPVGRISDALCSRLCFLWPILFFHFLCSKKKITLLSIIPLMGFLSRLLYAYASASRVGLVREILFFMIVYLLFSNSLSKKQRRTITKSFLLLFGVITLLLIIISVSRFNTAATKTINFTTWIALYLGEGPVKFCQFLWDVNVTMQGDNTFSFVKKILGMNPIIDLVERRDYWESISGIPNYIFYTWIGDIYFDLGRIKTIIYIGFFYCLSEWFISTLVKRKQFNLFAALILGLLILNLEFGIMYMPFKQYRIQIRIVWCIVFALIYGLLSKSKKKVVI